MLERINIHKFITPDPGQRVFFCGDIHGDMRALERALKKTGFSIGDDLLVLTGDIIDRGPESQAAVEFATCTPGIYSVLGNHELMFIEARQDAFCRHLYCSSKYGGAWTENLSEELLDELADLIKNCMSIAITVESPDFRIGVIHAESPDIWGEVKSYDGVKTQDWLTSVKQFEASKAGKTHCVTGIDATVHGHVSNDLFSLGNHVWIDTLHKTGELTVIEAHEIMNLVIGID